MSSCAVSCYTYCPEASSVFATLVSSPTADVPLFCRFAFNYSAQHSHHRPKQKPLLPRNRAHFGSVPNVAAACWSSRDLRLPRSNSVLHPLSPEPPHETTIPRSLPWCTSPPAGAVRPTEPRTSRPLLVSAQNLTAAAGKLQPNPSCLRFYQLQYLFPKPFS